MCRVASRRRHRRPAAFPLWVNRLYPLRDTQFSPATTDGWGDIAHSRREYDESWASIERYDLSTFFCGRVGAPSVRSPPSGLVGFAAPGTASRAKTSWPDSSCILRHWAGVMPM